MSAADAVEAQPTGLDPAVEVTRQLRRLIVELLARPGLDASGLELDTELAMLGVDSLDHIQIAARVQDCFGVKLNAGRLEASSPFRSLRQLAAAVQREIDERLRRG